MHGLDSTIRVIKSGQQGGKKIAEFAAKKLRVLGVWPQ